MVIKAISGTNTVSGTTTGQSTNIKISNNQEDISELLSNPSGTTGDIEVDEAPPSPSPAPAPSPAPRKKRSAIGNFFRKIFGGGKTHKGGSPGNYKAGHRCRKNLKFSDQKM